MLAVLFNGGKQMLATLKELLTKATKEGYGIPALVAMNEENTRTIIGCAEKKSAPVIVLVPYGFREFDMNRYGRYLRQLAEDATVPVCLCHDHGPDYQKALECIHGGLSSIMIDRSSLPFEDNVAQVKELAKIAHTLGVSVEAELGHVGFASEFEGDITEEAYTDPAKAKEFIDAAECDCLAVAIGTAHGAYAKGQVPHLDFDRLQRIRDAVGDFPLVLHGGSGVGDEQLAKAARSGISKINIGQELYQAAFDRCKEKIKVGDDVYRMMDHIAAGVAEVTEHYLDLLGSSGKA